MRKIIMFLLAFCLVAPVVEAQNKALEKELKKEYKDRKKELKKGGWEIFGTSRSADVTLLKHFDKLNTLGDDAKEVVGIASKFKSKNVGKQMAVNNACLTYAQSAGSYVKGRVMSDMAGDGVDAEGKNLLGVFFHAACRRGQDGHIHILQLADIFHHFIFGQFLGFVFRAMATNDARNFKIRRGFECLHGIMTDITVSHYGGSDLLHNGFLFY